MKIIMDHTGSDDLVIPQCYQCKKTPIFFKNISKCEMLAL